MTSKRIKWLDFGKGITILLVVLLHSLLFSGGFHGSGLLVYVLETIAMAVFFAISGYLYRPSHTLKGYKILLYKKIGSFVIPYCVFTLLGVFVFQLTNNHSFISNLYRIYYIPIGYLWFLYSLFFIFIIVGLMNLLHINLYVQIIFSFIINVGQMYLPWQESKLGNFNPLAGIGGYMICFYIGYLIKKSDLIKRYLTKNNYIYLATPWILLMIIQLVLTGTKYNTNVFNYGDFITKIYSIFLLFSFFIKFQRRHEKSRIFKYFDKYGKFTLIIYLIHLPICNFISKILGTSFNHLLLFLILFIVAWIGSILMCYLSSKLKVFNFIFYPRKYISKGIIKNKFI